MHPSAYTFATQALTAGQVRGKRVLEAGAYDYNGSARAALCVHDLLEHHPWIRTADWAYVRFHGPDARNVKYVGRYGGRRLWRPAERVAAWADEGVDAYVYFNNDYGGAAVEDAIWFRERVGPAARPRAGAAAATTRS